MENLEAAEIAIQAAKLWPHREHGASNLLSFFCRMEFHRWRCLDLAALFPGRAIAHCFWCSKVKVDGDIYDGR